MAASRFVEVTDEEINYFKENAYFQIIANVIILKQLFTSPQTRLFIHLTFGE